MLKFHALTVKSVYPETSQAVRVELEVPEALREAYRFVQGQHVNLEMVVDGESLRRSYSLCNGVDQPFPLQLVIKHQAGGRVSGYCNRDLRSGMQLRVMTPTGHFNTPLDPAARRRYVAFAAGSGITPVLSILRSTLAREPQASFTLFYGNRDAASVLCRDALHELKDLYTGRFRLFHILSQEPGEIELYNGRIDAAKCRALCEAFCDAPAIDHWFICGPASMIDEVSGSLRQLGVQRSRLHYERFASAGAPQRALRPGQGVDSGSGCTVKVIMDGKEREFGLVSGQSVLEAGLAQGLELPYSCTGGVCSTCRARLVEGKVDMRLNYALEPWEVEAGFVLACQSYPLSEHLVLDYDQT